MKPIFEPTDEMKAQWAEFVASRPEKVREVAARFEPWNLYRMKSTGHRVTVYSFGEQEDGGPVTLTVNVTGEFNAIMFDRQVFGISPDDLERCDLPAEGEITGTVLTEPAAVDGYIDAIRPAILANRKP